MTKKNPTLQPGPGNGITYQDTDGAKHNTHLIAYNKGRKDRGIALDKDNYIVFLTALLNEPPRGRKLGVCMSDKYEAIIPGEYTNKHPAAKPTMQPDCNNGIIYQDVQGVRHRAHLIAYSNGRKDKGVAIDKYGELIFVFITMEGDLPLGSGLNTTLPHEMGEMDFIIPGDHSLKEWHPVKEEE